MNIDLIHTQARHAVFTHAVLHIYVVLRLDDRMKNYSEWRRKNYQKGQNVTWYLYDHFYYKIKITWSNKLFNVKQLKILQ